MIFTAKFQLKMGLESEVGHSLQQGKEVDSYLHKWLLAVSKGCWGSRDTTPGVSCVRIGTPTVQLVLRGNAALQIVD